LPQRPFLLRFQYDWHFGWGEIFSQFRAPLTDTFGTKSATTNYGFLSMAQGAGSVLGAAIAASNYA
jgi:OFA family oxalate/formate antiporter-like MFS transporter